MKIEVNWATFVLILLIVMVLSFLAGWFVFILIRKIKLKYYQKKIDQARVTAIKITKEAKANAELEILYLKNAAENQINNKKAKLKELADEWEDKNAKIDQQRQELDVKKAALKEQENTYQKMLKKIKAVLLTSSHYTQDEAKAELFTVIKKQCATEFGHYVSNERFKAELQAKEHATNIILEAIERYAGDTVKELTTTVVKLKSGDEKGKIIGKEGINIKTFQNYSGVEVILNETSNLVTLSCFNPIRREIARLALQALLSSGIINPIVIETELDKCEKNLEEEILKTGMETVTSFMIHDMATDLIKMIGRLKFRTSFSQNVLNHSIEVAKISGIIAAELGLDIVLAQRSGLLHDIGKACDFDHVGSHVSLGVELATLNHEDPRVINAIAAHHGDCPKESYYAVIVSAADTLSAARPGSRLNVFEKHIEQLKRLEEICNAFPEVKKTFVFKSGRQVRVILDPVKITDAAAEILMQDIKTQISTNRTIPGDIIIDVIRESKFTTKII